MYVSLPPCERTSGVGNPQTRKALPLQGDLGEQEMRGGAADVDADRLELDRLLPPDVARELCVGTL